jgi:hypothetical protein
MCDFPMRSLRDQAEHLFVVLREEVFPPQA